MFINFSVNINTTFLYGIEAELNIEGTGVLSISMDDLIDSYYFDELYSERGVDGLKDFIFDYYLNDEDLNEERVTLNENDLKEVFNAYLKEKGSDT